VPVTKKSFNYIINSYHGLHFLIRRSYVRRFIRHFPKIQEMLQYSSECAVCGESFLNTWLECVHFVDAKKVGLP